MARRKKTVNLYDAKTHLSKLVDEASKGGEIVIAKGGKPQARLVPLESPRPPRVPGGWESGLWVAEDFDDELPREILAGFLDEDAGAEES
jgi:prevent-host-death family protein